MLTTKVEILIGDCREKLREMPDASVHCCVTSPPYFGLRDYGTGEWIGGDPACEHTLHRQASTPSSKNSTSQGALRDSLAGVSECRHCGATRVDSQIGLEPTPDEFVAAMVAVFREVRRVLRDDGTLWLNIGDSYSTHAAGKVANPMAKSTLAGVKTQEVANTSSRAKDTYRNHTLPEKNLIGIPWMLAFALQADGWFLRQDIIWSKPNPMPESVRDRCTKAHEYLFLLSKAPRYYFDAEAIQEDGVCPAGTKGAKGSVERLNAKGVNSRPPEYKIYSGKRNKRSVWTVTTKPFSGAHFATYPPDLIEPCIRAGCPVGGMVLDPFGGAGTTGLAAMSLGRNATLIELNPEYAEIARERIHGTHKFRRPASAPENTAQVALF
jgi:DNA modification methylase